MYMYMQSGHAGTVGSKDLKSVNTEGERKRLRSEPSSTKRKYVNLSRVQQLNLHLPGSEYGEGSKKIEGNETSGMETESGIRSSDVDMDHGEQHIYANCNDEEDLYTAMV